jgi:futalosine hydrolase
VGDIVVCYATALEGEGLPRTSGGQRIRLVETGVGPVNAAFALTRALSAGDARAVLICGVGGAFAGAGLEPGDVACATTEMYGDLGADSPGGFLDMTALGFPVMDLPLDLFPAERRVPFVTCATCTGTDARAAELVGRTGAAVESMEGAALVQVARMMGVPAGEVRGISNIAGARDRASGRLREAAAAARAALTAWLEAGAC